jgi:hypothetical protein
MWGVVDRPGGMLGFSRDEQCIGVGADSAEVVRDRFDGRPLDENRRRTTWPTVLNPSTYRGLARLDRVSARVVTGRVVERRPLSQFDR